ncbi:hypothetical protein TCAL_16531 [Tigriopus californicus]|uniref:Uncharacterized protein n=1 Tax=Tigriopus californicus TaxID=6832 RepID=A0A553NSZ7_TIGCA|nr:hypothetical protein TCAL_16531 [Tigriopus californicus]
MALSTSRPTDAESPTEYIRALSLSSLCQQTSLSCGTAEPLSPSLLDYSLNGSRYLSLVQSSGVSISAEQISGREHAPHFETSIPINDKGIPFDVELFFQREPCMLKVSKAILGMISGELKAAQILFQLINLLDQSGFRNKRKE